MSDTLEEVLSRHSGGPQNGIFTDGSARPNPGPGGWGVVLVVEGKMVEQRHGSEAQTTNNRMELTALINGFRFAPPDLKLDVYSDSEICVKTVNEWAASWEKKGWRRSGGPIKNLELVQELYALSKERPLLHLKWIKAHNGWLWNEYADSLSCAWTRSQL